MPAVSTNSQQPKAKSVERRSFFRVNDAVALNVNKLEPDLLKAAQERLQRREHELQALAGKGDSNTQLQTALRDVEAKHPEVANLFRLFESRIDSLVQALSQQDKSAQESPNVVVSMSGSGLGFDWPTAYYEGEYLLVEMTLFPLQYQIEAIAKIVRGNPAERATDGKFHCALEFVEIAHTDREVLLQHVHNLQLESLRSRNDADF